MGEEKNASYYDNIFNVFPHYALDVNGYNSPWFHISTLVMDMLNKEEKILELGCGTGQFAEILINKGYNYIHGMDFSPQAISMSKERCKKDIFQCENIYKFNFNEIDFDIAICIEVFEHIEKDLMIIRKIPKGKKIIFTVPSYDAGGHVRYFSHKEKVIKRFKSEFTIFDVKENNNIYFICAVK